MIRVIASDMDGTLLNENHMNISDCKVVYNVLKKYNITCMFVADKADYCIGSLQEREQELVEHIRVFQPNLSEAEIRKSELFSFMTMNTKMISSFEELEKQGTDIIKIFAMSNDLDLLKKVNAELQKNRNLAVASSFANNIEVTDRNAQKGIALKHYIESLGYTMEEVMVFGDSMNDYSMLSMDFGVTIAMENGMQQVKDVAKYTTKSNAEDGVAYVIEELLMKKEL